MQRSSIDADVTQECYICQDASSLEPLVQPCRCQGSIANVHASCIEAWVCLRRQQDSPDAEVCHVCRAQYVGLSRRPGLTTFVAQLVRSAGRELMMYMKEVAHFVLLALVLFGYVDSATSTKEGVTYDSVVIYTRSIILPMVALHFHLLYNFVSLMTSLRGERKPPTGWLAKLFFSQDSWCLVRQQSQLVIAGVWISLAYVCGKATLLHTVPANFAAIVSAISFLRSCDVIGVVEAVHLFVAELPWVGHEADMGLLASLRQLILRMTNLLDGVSHVLITVTAIGLSIGFRSQGPVTTLFGVHCIVLVAGLVEITTIRHFQWRDGGLWWLACAVGVQAANLALDCHWLDTVLFFAFFGALKKAVEQLSWSSCRLIASWCVVFAFSEEGHRLIHEHHDGPDRRMLVSSPWRPHSRMGSGAPSRAAAVPIIPGPRTLSAKIIVCVWVVLLGALACAVNSRRYYRRYRRWQRRHATFALHAPVRHGGDLGGGMNG